MSDHELNKESLHFLGRLLAFLEVSDMPEGLSLDIKVGLNYYVTPLYRVVESDEAWLLEPIVTKV